MEYSFRPFLDELETNWYRDDDLLRALLRTHAGDGGGRGGPVDGGGGPRGGGVRGSGDGAARAGGGRDAASGEPGGGIPREDELAAWGATVSGPLRELARESARPENRPRLRHHDAHDRRVDEILLPGSTRRALAEAEGAQGLGALHGDPFRFYARTYLCHQNGEAGVACSMACTDGLVRALEALGDRPEHERAVDRVRASDRDRVWHGAQFVTEIQGGSDVPANDVRARRDGDAWRLRGQKWFCSNVNADYYLVTARPEGAPEGGEGIGLFLVPARRDGEEVRNGHTVDRLKEKLGTRELATAEVTFDGAVAWPVGPLERGLPNLVRHVLVPSRFGCVISSAGFLRRAQRIVEAYTEFREAFGRPIGQYPLVRRSVEEIRRAREETLAAVFGLLALWERARGGEGGGDRGRYAAGDGDAAGDGEDGPAAGAGGASRDAAAARVDFRVMLSLCKPVLTGRATRLLHEAMMLLGGNGIEEEFSPLPRLHRDAVIMEAWEGPHNVLLTQALRDLARFGVDPESFVGRLADAAPGALAGDLDQHLAAADDPATTIPFARWARRMVGAFARRELARAGAGPGAGPREGEG